jgi:hypothetical protein
LVKDNKTKIAEKKGSPRKKVPPREKYMDALLVSGQIFTAQYFPKLEIAINLHLAGDETNARIKFNEACTDAHIPQEMVWDLWDLIVKITPSLKDALAWLPSVGP